MKHCIILLLVLALVGCGGSGATEAFPGVSKEQLVPTLEKIAETGEYRDVLMDLTVGLENEGYMDQAAAIQQFESLTDVKQIRALASRVASTIAR